MHAYHDIRIYQISYLFLFFFLKVETVRNAAVESGKAIPPQ